MTWRSKTRGLVCAACTLTGLAFGCRLDMHDGPNRRTFEPSSFFEDGSSARPLVAGTVSQNPEPMNDLFYTGRINGRASELLPYPVTPEMLARGQERFNINCSPCHGRTGYGDGMIVQRGFRQPPSYHIERLRQAPIGHFFEVITNGFGAMYSYADRVSPGDRWAIAAYIRALQLSQYASLDDVPAAERKRLTGGPK